MNKTGIDEKNDSRRKSADAPDLRCIDKLLLLRVKEMSRTFAIHTLGCKLNYSESSSIACCLTENGFTKVQFKEKAELYVINTCSVTQEADKECRQIVRSVLRRAPGAFIAITGCYAQLKPEEIAGIEGVDLVLGASEKFNLPLYLDNLDKKGFAQIHSCEIEKVNIFHPAYSSGDRTRSFLKVQDGCDYNCSYCTIPLARGGSRSDSIANVNRNVYSIALKGIKEIVLTGVNLGDYREPQSGAGFFELIQTLEDTKAPVRFRISSIEPNLLKDEIIEWVRRSQKFVPHFHIPLQSGADAILKKMRRRYLRDLYTEKVTRIKSLMPHCSIGVDVIAGFPGETDEYFSESYEFLRSLDVSYLHVFTYSERDNTSAVLSDLESDSIPMEIRRKRNRMLQILSEKKERRFFEQNVGSVRPVLFEARNRNGFLYGYTDNYIRVKTVFNKALQGQVAKVELGELTTDGMMSAALAKPIIPDFISQGIDAETGYLTVPAALENIN